MPKIHRDLAPPPVFSTLREVFAPFEWLKTALISPLFRTLPKGDGRPVMLIPGYIADEFSMLPLKRFLQKLNYEVFDWQLGRNAGKVDYYLKKIGPVLERLSAQTTKTLPFTLIGWSLGGTIARELARVYPQYVKEVITLGSPITGGPKYTAIGKRYARRQRLDMETFELEVLERNKLGFSQPVTSIYSKKDGIVSWRASVDVYNPQARNIEVDATHFGIGINEKVWRIIAAILAEDESQKPQCDE